MNRWQTLLSEDGAEWQGDQLVAFTQTVHHADTLRTPLLGHAVLSVSGQQPADFLQGQVTCDMRTVSDAQARFGSHCTPKGRALFDFVAWSKGDQVLLRQDQTLTDITRNQLERYGVFSRIKVTADNALCGIGLCGTNARHLIEQHLGIVMHEPTDLYEGKASVTGCGDGSVLAFSQPHQSTDTLYEVWLPETDAIAFWQAIQAHTSPLPPSFWAHRFIQRGISQLNHNTSGKYIPQQLNSDIVQAISFQKGCYTGQEVIARLHYKGDTKKRIGLFHTFSDTPLTSGQALYGNSGAKVGDIINAAPILPSTEFVASTLAAGSQKETSQTQTPWGVLAVVPKEAIHGQGEAPLFLGDDGSFPLQSYPLPYPIAI